MIWGVVTTPIVDGRRKPSYRARRPYRLAYDRLRPRGRAMTVRTVDGYTVAVDILAADGLARYSAEVIISNERGRGEASSSLVAYARRLVAARHTRNGRAARRKETS